MIRWRAASGLLFGGASLPCFLFLGARQESHVYRERECGRAVPERGMVRGLGPDRAAQYLDRSMSW
jgi:hypothetical protein